MPNFKPKPNKEINVDKQSIVTVDSKHKEMMDMFESSQELCKSLRKQRALIKKSLNDNRHLFTVDTILTLKDEIENLTTRITKLENDEKDYLLSNSKYLFDYFLKKQDIRTNQNKKKIVTSFFNIKPSACSIHSDSSFSNIVISMGSVIPSFTPEDSERGSTAELLKEATTTRDDSVHRYMSNLDESYITITDYTTLSTVCFSCGGEIVPITNEGMTVCKKCGIQLPYIIDQNQHSGKEPPKEVSFYAYKRINHFREILAQVQGKETTTVSDEVIDNIKNQMRKERITLEQMTNEKTKMILKNLGYNKYYEHIPFIKEKLGIKPPVMPVELEQKLCNLFLEIQKPYAKFCPDERVNFLNYYYVLYKMCELLEADEYLDHFYMLKDPVKRMEQDEIWKKICKELNWEFIPTP
jgi:hypothetical protein